MTAPFAQNLPRFQLGITGSVIFLVVVAVAAIVLTAFVYRRTVPQVRPAIRRLLLVLRATALVLVIILLFQPIIRLTFARQQPPTIAVLVDDSASMGLTDGLGNRGELVKKALQAPVLRQANKKYDVRFFRFAEKVAAWELSQDTLKFDEDGTDLQTALAQCKQELRDRHLAATIVLTDGAYNLGENPARYAASYGVPIYVVGIGDSAEAKDLLISSYNTNDVVYEGNRVPIDVTVKSHGFDGQRLPVELKKDGQTIDRGTLTLAGGMLEQVATLHFTPTGEGLQKYELSLPSLDGELTTRNNQMSFHVKVLKGKMKVLLVAGGPSTDFAFLRRALDSDENVELTTFVERHRGTFYEGSFPRRLEDLKGFDLIVLLDYPRSTSNPAVVKAIADLAIADAKPLLLLPGPETAFSRLAPLKSILPIAGSPSTTSEQQVFIQLASSGLHHPLLRIKEEQIDNVAQWQALPPVYSVWANIRPAPGSETLAQAVRERDGSSGTSQPIPMILARRAAGSKAIAVMAYGLWRWQFLMAGTGKSSSVYQTFFSNAVRWLATREESKLVRVRPNKDVYHSGEQVEFTAQVYYADYVPVDGAEVKVSVRADTTVEEITLQGAGGGRYEGEIQVLAGGDYSYEATASREGRSLGSDRGQFSVEPFTLEYQNTRMNEPLLRDIAARSEGGYYTPGNLEALQTNLNLEPQRILEAREVALWNAGGLLVIAVLLLSAEWIIRKRMGMP